MVDPAALMESLSAPPYKNTTFIQYIISNIFVKKITYRLNIVKLKLGPQVSVGRF